MSKSIIGYSNQTKTLSSTTSFTDGFITIQDGIIDGIIQLNATTINATNSIVNNETVNTLTVSSNLIVNGSLFLTGNITDINTEMVISDAMRLNNILGDQQTSLVVEQTGTIQPVAQMKANNSNIFTLSSSGIITDNATINSLENKTANQSRSSTVTSFSGECRFKQVAFSYYLFPSGSSYTINANNTIFFAPNSTLFVDNYSSFNNTAYGFRAPFNGVYRIDVNMRFSDGTSDYGIKPTIVGVRYIVGGDNIVWCPTDGSSNRRVLQWSHTVYMTQNQVYDIHSANTSSIVYVVVSGSYVSSN